MSKAKNVLIIVATFLILFLTFLIIKDISNKKVIEVSVAKASLKDIRKTISFSGFIDAREKVQVAFELAGRVKAVYFKEQDTVVKGQILARLVNNEITAQLEQAKAGVHQAEISLKSIERNLKRAQELYKKGFLSLEGMEAVQTEYDIGCELLAQKKAIYEAIKAKANSYEILAPITGTIIRKFIKEGEIVAGPLSASKISEPVPVAEIADLNTMEVVTDIDETEISNIYVGQSVLIKVDAYPDQILGGKVREVPLITSEKRETGKNYQVKISFNNKPSWLRLGMTANVDFVIQEKKKVLCVPVEGILQREKKFYVFLLNKGRVFEKEVKLGITDEEYQEILSGLNLGEEIVIGDLTKLSSGARVKVVKS